MVAVPTAAELKARYPEFDGVPDALVTALIAEASGMVDDDWIEADQKPGIMALAAHMLFLEGYPARVTNPGGYNPGTSASQMIMRKVGDVTVQYAQASAGTGGGSMGLWLGLSAYGLGFQRLMKLNAPAIGLV